MPRVCRQELVPEMLKLCKELRAFLKVNEYVLGKATSIASCMLVDLAAGLVEKVEETHAEST